MQQAGLPITFTRLLIARLAVALLFAFALVALPARAEEAQVDYMRDIRPIFAAHCYDCHGPDEEEGGLRLDQKARALEGGASGEVIKPGKPDESLLLQFITGNNEDKIIMPPKDQGEPLGKAQMELVRSWIADGAEWPDGVDKVDDTPRETSHWSFLPVKRPAVPKVDSPWVRTSIDAFILAKLSENNLSPSEEASRLTLLRRATYDLTGLPPTPEEVQDFLKDESPKAFEKVVDRLLDSPRYGERWARHWLDLARYADSDGFEQDVDRPLAYHYRDYVIKSFNDDKPYDQFVLEQLAGDEIAPGDLEALTATGFCRNGPSISNQALEKNRLDELDDVISTTSTVFLGLTVGCARCHNHKFEPISQRDYYQMLAIFNSSVKREIDSRMCIQDAGPEAKTTHILVRGDHRSPGREVGPGIPEVLAFRPVEFAPLGPEMKSTGRRAALARWIASGDNPLTARVMVNRIWQYHFGEGLVPTPSNFGESGSPPSHPELLDWLAAEFVDHGWRLKHMHRLIMTSAVYRQDSTYDATRAKVDPANTWHWRFSKRRLEAEVIRDAVLQAAGTLNPKMYGPGIHPRIDPTIIATGSTAKWPIIEKEGPEHWRRSVYIFIKRSVLLPMMEGFDAPTTTETCARRLTTTVATQALQLMNGQFSNEQASYMAARIVREVGNEPAEQAERAYWLALSRPPSAGERDLAREFIAAQRILHLDRLRAEEKVPAREHDEQAHQRALADLCHVLFNSNEFVYIN